MKSLLLLFTAGCVVGAGPDDPPDPAPAHPLLSTNAKLPRYAAIRDAAATHGIANAYLLAGIANDETGLAMCWSEATWACQGPGSSDCGGGPVIAGAADGPCSAQQGGLGMFQFDAGTFADTIHTYGGDVLTVAGQTSHAIDYAVQMVKISAYTTDAETDAKARAWIDRFDPANPTLVDQWISTVVRYYNGCEPGWSCWSDRYRTYSDGFHLAIDEPGGLPFWAAGTRCAGSPPVIGEIEQKYLALGGCTSLLGVPITGEQGTPDGIGRYSVFEQGSIYWTPQLGAHEVHGRIRDAWAQAGWEAGALGYPISDEYAVAGGRRSDFEHGAITWDSSLDQTSITMNGSDQ
jgi:LGFP repeat